MKYETKIYLVRGQKWISEQKCIIMADNKFHHNHKEHFQVFFDQLSFVSYFPTPIGDSIFLKNIIGLLKPFRKVFGCSQIVLMDYDQ